jgi:hypothetical protein
MIKQILDVDENFHLLDINEKGCKHYVKFEYKNGEFITEKIHKYDILELCNKFDYNKLKYINHYIRK